MGKRSVEVHIRGVRKTLILDVQGEVDLFSSPKMRSAIIQAINTKGFTRVAINLSGVKYIDSSGIATLVEGLQLARSKNCRFLLFGLQEAAKEVLELARLEKIFDIRVSEDDALNE